MMRSRFEEQLTQLNTEMLEMGALIERAIENASEALEKRDLKAADRAIDIDDLADRKEKDIESLCIKMLLQQQPVARDLRQISAALKMITDMERISDQAADISEIVKFLAEHEPAGALRHLPQMAKVAIRMVTGSIDAYVKRDVGLARTIIDMDDEIDRLFSVIRKELIDLIREDNDNAESAMDMLMIAKYFERIGDHAQNIAEWVEYSITGMHKGEYI